MFVFSGGTASGAVVAEQRIPRRAAGRHRRADTTGAIVSTGVVFYSLDSGVTVDVSSATDTVVGSSGAEYVLPGGTTTSTTVSGGGTRTVYAGGTVSFTALSSGGFEVVSSGGTAISTMVSAGGVEGSVRGGGDQRRHGEQRRHRRGVVRRGGQWCHGERRRHRGRDRRRRGERPTLDSGGTAFVSAGGRTVSTMVDSRGVEAVYGSGTASFATVSAGGSRLFTPLVQRSAPRSAAAASRVASGGSAGLPR